MAVIPRERRGLWSTSSTLDGRTLAVQEGGDPAGRPLLVHPGLPNSSRHQYAPFAADAAGRGLRLISYDRPGYGGSGSLPERTVADCADDVRAICAALTIDRLAMWGWSAGGPYVLACAALLPDLVTAVASLASLAPYNADSLDYCAGMGQDNVDDDRLLLTDPAAARAKLDKDWEQLLAASASDMAQGLASLLSPADAAILTGEWAEFLAYSPSRGASTRQPGVVGRLDRDRHAVGVRADQHLRSGLASARRAGLVRARWSWRMARCAHPRSDGQDPARRRPSDAAESHR
jgi:pimeloyl-ACP methyl ester carboxylesterase